MEVVYDKTGVFLDLPTSIHGQRFRRVLLRKKFTPEGAFCKLLGNIQIELIQALDRTPKKLLKTVIGAIAGLSICVLIPWIWLH